MTRDEALRKFIELCQQPAFAAQSVGDLDLSIVKKLLPLLVVIIPPIAPFIGFIERLLELIEGFGVTSLPASVVTKLNDVLDEVKALRAPGAAPPTA